MATFLYRLGRLAFRKRRYVALLWIAALVGLGLAAGAAPKAADDGFSMPGTQSQQAFDLLNQRFPGPKADGASARLVFVAPQGHQVSEPQYKALIEQAIGEVSAGPQFGSAADPFAAHAVSQDGSTAYASIDYSAKNSDITSATTDVLKNAAAHARTDGMSVEIGGNALQAKPEMGGATEVIGIGLAAVVLIITFGSLVAAGLPLLTALIGIGAGMAAIIALGMSTTTTTLAMMLGLAVGIDYAVFIVSRYRTERAQGRDAQEAVARATATAGSAVVFAGLTVVIALAGLAVIGIPVLTKMGLAAAGTVAVAVLVALTLVPALLGFCQRLVLPRKLRSPQPVPAPESVATPMGTRWARFIVRRPLPVLLLGVVGLAVLAAPLLDLKMGMPGDESQPTSTTQRRAYDDLSRAFGPGFNGPLTVVVDVQGVADPQAAVQRVAATVSGTHGVVSVSPARFDQAGDTAVFIATPSTGPSADATKDLVNTLRGEAGALKSDTGATLLVSGTTAMNIDVSQKMSDALIPYLAVVVGLAFLLLMVVFRSLLVPLKAALGFLLSVSAALGVIVAVFQWGWLADLIGVHQTGPVVSMMPIFMIGVVFGLAMDYEVFLVTRMREAYVHGESAHESIVTGFRQNARVVTAAAVIMIAVFSGFIGTSEAMIKMMGLGLAAAVFFDAFVVRMTIVPAVLALLGDRAWWLPRWLAKILPAIDIEGSGLAREVVQEQREAIPVAP